MKRKIYALLMVLSIIVVSCGEVEVTDPCETDNTGFMTVINGTSGTDAIGMDVLIDGNYIVTISPGGSTDLIELDVDSYTVTGEASDKTRSWPKDVTITQCTELVITLGN